MKKRSISLLAITLLLAACSFSSPKNNNLINKDKENPILVDRSFETETKYIEIETNDVKKIYELNEELDTSYLIVKRHLNNGEVIIINNDEYTVNDVDTSLPGFKDVIIKADNFFASYRITVKGFIGKNYDEKYVYYLGETFNNSLFSLKKYDEYGEHIINDYSVSFPDNTKIGLGQIVITYEDYEYVSNIAILKKQDNVPAIFFSVNSDSKLMLFANNIHNTTYNGEKVVVSEGNYLLVKSDVTLELYDYRYMLYTPLNASYFGSDDHCVEQRLIPGGDLLVTINDEMFIVDASTWHHCLIGW